MRASTINHIRERIAHANQQHGEFASADHIIAAAGIELMEATVAAHYAGDVVHELLDGAVVLIRGAEQLGGIEGCFYDPAEEVAQFIYGHHGQQRIEEATRIMSYLAAHAVIDVPPGVPSVPVLEKIGGGTFIDARQAGAPDHEASKLRATAIRDAVLAGVAAPAPTADEVDALARVLQGAYSKHIGYWPDFETWTSYRQEGFRAEARAAIAHLRKRSAVTVPQGVPEIKALREIGINAYLMHEQAKRENAGCMVGPMGAAADAILTALAPWLQPRTVTEEQIEKAARGLYENYEIWSWGRAGNWVKESDVCRNLWKDRAIATFEAAGFSVEGQSDAAV